MPRSSAQAFQRHLSTPFSCLHPALLAVLLALALCSSALLARAQDSTQSHANDAFDELERESRGGVEKKAPKAEPADDAKEAADSEQTPDEEPAPKAEPAPRPPSPPAAPARPTATAPAPTPAPTPSPSAPSRRTVQFPPSKPAAPAQLREGLDIRRMTQGDYRDVVIAAREAMRLIYGEMTPEQNQRFEKNWTPHLAFPTGEAVEYFNKLNPLLNEFLSLRETIYRASQEFEAAWAEAMVSAGQELAGAAEEALAVAGEQKEVLQSLNGRLDQVTAAIVALGDPPDAEAARKRRKKQHDDAIAAMRNLVPAPAQDEPAAPDAGVWVFQELLKKETPADPQNSKSTNWVQNKTQTEFGAGSLSAVKETTNKSGGFRVAGISKDGVKQLVEDNDPYTHRWQVNLSWSEPPKTLKLGESFTISCSADGSATTTRADKPVKSTAYSVQIFSCVCDNSQPKCSKTVTVREVFWGKERSIKVSAVIGSASRSIVSLSWGAVTRQYVYQLARDAADAEALAKARDQAEQAKSDDNRFESDEEASKQASIHFHETNIQIIEQNIAREQEALSRETDKDRRDALEYRLRNLRSNIQAEQDLIASIKTGEYVHTRTEADDYISKQFVANIYADQQRMRETQSQVAELQRLAGFLPEGEVEQARALINKLIDAGDIIRGDMSKVGPLREALINKVGGYVQQAQAQQEIASADRTLRYLEAAKGAGNVAAMVVFGNTGAAVYAGVTGFYTDGAAEGVKAAASWYSMGGYYAVEAYEGFHKGGFLTKGGAVGAGERAGTAIALNTLIEYGVPKIGALFRGMEGAAAKTVRGVEQAALTEAEKMTMKEFKESIEQGKKLAAEVRLAETQLIQARAGNYPAAAIKELEAKALAKAAQANEDYAAKNFLKQGGNNFAAQAQERLMGKIYEKTHEKAIAELKRLGYNTEELAFQEFRNASSKGSFGMDHDWGVMSKSESGWLTKKGKPVGELTLQKDGAKAFEDAYREVTQGRSGKAAFAEFTTKAHPEAFVDLNVLKNLKDPENVRRLNTMWGEQTARTIEYKGMEMLNRADLKSFQGFQEASRGLAKELDKKVIPLINAAQGGKGLSPEGLKRTAAQFAELKGVLAAFGESKIDPVTASRRIREITGGKDLPEVLDQVRNVTEAVYKMGNITARPPVLDIRVLNLFRDGEDDGRKTPRNE